MNFKSYYGSTIREALNSARADLGLDASILASRQVDPSEDLPGKFEVVAGVVPSLSTRAAAAATQAPVVRRLPAGARVEPMFAPAGPAPAAVAPPPPPQEAVTPRRDSGLSHIRRKVNSIRQAIAPESRGDEKAQSLEELRSTLRMDGFDESLCSEVISGVKRRMKDNAGADLETLVALELDARAAVEPVLGRNQAKRHITALVGPPGAGKTSLIVKLAVKYGLTARRPLRLISLDGSRVGGADSLVSYAAGMAVPVDVVETGMAVSQLLEGHPEAGMILIDTPGLSPGDMASASEFAAVLARNPEIDVQLVLPATMSPRDMRAAFTRFRPFLPARIAITHTDTAISSRAAIGIALMHELPLSFCGTGPRIPEDVAEISVERLLMPAAPAAKGRAKSAVSAA